MKQHRNQYNTPSNQFAVKSYVEVSQVLGITPEHVRWIEKEALRKCRLKISALMAQGKINL